MGKVGVTECDASNCRLVLWVAAMVMLAAILAQARAAGAAQILVVLSGDEVPYREAAGAAQDSLARLGHTVRSIPLAEFAKDSLNPAAQGYDALVAIGTEAAVSLHEQVKSQAKLVYCMVAHPEAVGLVGDPSVSGISTDVPIDAQVKMIAEALPKLRTVGMLYRSDVDKSTALLKTVQAAMPKDWRLEAVAVNKYEAMADAIDALLEKNVEIVWTAPDSSVYDVATIRSLLLAAIRRKTPVFGFSRAFVQAGALLGTAIDAKAQGEQAAALTDRLLQRPQAASQPTTKAATLGKDGISEPPRFQTVVNLIVAEKLNLTVSEDVVRRATYVIKPDKEQP